MPGSVGTRKPQARVNRAGKRSDVIRKRSKGDARLYRRGGVVIPSTASAHQALRSAGTLKMNARIPFRHETKRDEEKGRVVLFRPRIPQASNDNLRDHDARGSPVEDIGKYARGEHDNYRHRMLNNLVAFLWLCLIVYCGIWLAGTMTQLRKDQDCVLSGRTNCSPIHIPANTR